MNKRKELLLDKEHSEGGLDEEQDYRINESMPKDKFRSRRLSSVSVDDELLLEESMYGPGRYSTKAIVEEEEDIPDYDLRK